PPRPGTCSRSRQANRLPLLLLLSAHGTPRTLAGARVGARPLAAHGQTAAVAQAPVAADVHQPLDVHLHAATQVAFHLVVGGDKIAQTVGFLLGQVPHLRVGIHARRPKNLLGAGTANAVNVRQPNDDPLVAGQVDAGNSRHRPSPPSPASACVSGSRKSPSPGRGGG